MNDQYSTYLQSPEWQQRRARCRRDARNRCEACKFKGPLDAHHLTYARIFNEDQTDLMALCRECHDRIEAHVAAGHIGRNGNTAKLRARTIAILIETAANVPQPRTKANRKPAKQNTPGLDELRSKHHLPRADFLRFVRDKFTSGFSRKRRAVAIGRAMKAFDRVQSRAPTKASKKQRQQQEAERLHGERSCVEFKALMEMKPHKQFERVMTYRRMALGGGETAAHVVRLWDDAQMSRAKAVLIATECQK